MSGDGRTASWHHAQNEMTETILAHEDITIEGLYGDREVRICRCAPSAPGGADVVLLHGVHSFANLSPQNKFRLLAELLTKEGFTAWLVETSRVSRHRDEGEDYYRWIENTFGGKTFAQEREDVFRAVREILARNGGKPVWLWGFSLGGIIAASAAGAITLPDGKTAIDRLIVSGTGLWAYPRAEEEMLRLPILSTLRDTLSPETLLSVKTNRVISFRGEYDEIFPEKSCREFIEKICLPEEKKAFLTIARADHSLRRRDGKSDVSIMKEMVDFLIK